MAKSYKSRIKEDMGKDSVVDALIGNTEKPAPEKKSYNVQVKKKETRSRRLQLLMTPSLYAKVDREANKLGVSVNELINTVLDGVL